MEYIAGHYHMDPALAWALRLEGKTDQEKLLVFCIKGVECEIIKKII